MALNQQDHEQLTFEQGHYRRQINDEQTPRHSPY